ncbi:TIGR04211 family SH3 domain-containing protein [Ferrimonas balearica]|uniref:TIGR04211 family SH3 domain-containing protein n=1 Tax=Ferrimonas balearica TaxID=44012 RepID=UPI001C993FB8|nr:TIGR04211 family SH3 domain-containing protein [Ferrimonas balearica]MBY5992323.1 TIGR04211 family SH3 domain-containing protein [Ferrimonas balearica]
MSKRIFAALLCLLAVSGTSMAREATHTVSEDIYIYLLAGPSTQFRILGSLKAGDPLVATGETQGEYSQVIDERGRTGWIQTEQLAAGQSFRTQLPALTRSLEEAREQLKAVTAERDDLLANSASAANESRSQARELTRLERENTELKAEVAKLSNSERFIWMQQGGMVAGAGLILGLILAYLPRPKRRKKNDRWM